MSAAAEVPASEADRAGDTVIFPQGAEERGGAVPARGERGGGGWLLTGALLLAAGGAWILLRRRGILPARVPGAAGRKIVIEESRSLGGRQYLVVAGYEEKKFLLGVSQGRIQMLGRLDVDGTGDGEDPGS